IQHIPIGTALVTGVVDLPLLVAIRPRMSKHGGEAISAFLDDDEMTEEPKEDVAYGDVLPIVKQPFSIEDIRVMHGAQVQVTHEAVPCALLLCTKNEEEFRLLVDLVTLNVIENSEDASGQSLLDLKLQDINQKQEKILALAVTLGAFTPGDLFGKSGLTFSEFYDAVQTLERKGYLMKEGNGYTLSSSMRFLATLDTKRFYQPLTYTKTNATLLLAKYPMTVVRDFLNKFIEVKDVKDCYLEKYTVA
ncbi:MAG TPA: hypothetical protein VJJ79_03040, partial [Candidatus Nanoarchaeia archaeon]|nr:hypothetical protein [Candidatus Nanoarchaeia archaeon]